MCREIAFRFFVVGSRKVQYAIPANKRLFMKMIDRWLHIPVFSSAAFISALCSVNLSSPSVT